MTKRTIIEATSERDILSWMIASDEVYRHIVAKYDSPRLFESQFSRTVATWIHEWAKLEPAKAPGESMAQIYAVHQSEVADETTSRAVQEFLGNLSRDWASAEPLSAPFAKDQADLYFRRRTVARALEMAQRALESGTSDGLAQAENAFLSFSRPGLRDFQIVDLLNDHDKIHDAYNDSEEVLFRMPGCLDQLLGPIVAGDLVGLLAPAKRGKSFWVDLFSICAMYQGKKVLIVDFELVQNQKARRLWGHLQGLPRAEKTIDLPGFSNTGEIVYKQRTVPGISPSLKDIQEFSRGVRRTSQGGSVKFMNVPTYGTTVREIMRYVKDLRTMHGWEPDLIVWDSPDYLEAENKKQELRHQLHEIWGHVRGVSQELPHCACLAPSHTTSKTIKGEGDDEDISEDKRKLQKVTKTLFLNQTKAEKQAGIMRVSTSTSRDEETTTDQVVVLQHLGINRPYLDSRWLSQVRSDLVYRPKGKSDILD